QDVPYYNDSDETFFSHNVISAKLSDKPNSGSVVIGAHYDTLAGSVGANDNACGISALLTIGKQLKDIKFDFNIIFVAFGAEELGSIGSKTYVRGLSEAQKDNIMLMINFDVIGSGDNLYVYGEDVSTNFTNAFVSTANNIKTPAPLLSKPLAQDIILLSYSFINNDKVIYQTVQNTDQQSFRDVGIPSMLFFSGSFGGKYVGYVESQDESKWTMNTSKDNKEVLYSNLDAVIGRVETVVATVCATLKQDNFLSIATGARGELVADIWTNAILPMVVYVLLLIGCIVGAVVVHQRLVKQSLLGGPVDIVNKKVFTKPDSDDIFTFRK
ncbi:MAG: M28 family metallopeptidase, partial [Clostridia bacterium]